MSQRPILHTKDAGGDDTQAFHPEVQAEVLAQVKAMAGNVKGISDKLTSDFAALQETVKTYKDGMDGLVESKITKLTEAIVTRQEALDKLAAEQKSRIDQLDLAFQRQGRFGAPGQDEAKLFEAAREFAQTKNVLRKINKEVEDNEIDVKGMLDYQRAFKQFMRLPINIQGLTPDLEKYLSVGSEVDGGILVPPTVSSRIGQRVWEMDVMRQLASVETIGGDTWEELQDLDEADDGWATETTTNGETGTPQLNKVSITTHWQEAEPKATQQIMMDASRNPETWLADKVAKKFARTEGAAFVTGNGVNRPRGFLDYPVYANSNTNNYFVFGQVEYVPAGDSVLSASAFIRLFYHLLEDFQGRATFLMNRFTVMKTMLLQDTSGRPLWQPAANATIANGAPSTILNAPVRMSSSMPVVAANAYSVAFADWQEAYKIIDRQGITTLRDPYTSKPFIKFFTRRKVGGGLVNFQAIKLLKMAAT